MSDDWIKMRIDLQKHPKIVRLMQITSMDQYTIIGALHAVWCIFDAHSEDGVLHGYTHQIMDQMIHLDQFSASLEMVGWLKEVEGNRLVMPEFTSHNGKSAKKRSEDAKRKRESRKRPQNVRELSEDQRTKNGLEKEKEKEYINRSFDAFWDAYPRRVGKKKSFDRWCKISPDEETQKLILKNIRDRIHVGEWDLNRKEFIPHPDTFLNQERWNDEITIKNQNNLKLVGSDEVIF